MEYYLYIKSLHLIFIVIWFAWLFYVPRLLVYQIEAFYKPSLEKEILGEQLKLMAKRLWYIITWSSAVLATLFAVNLTFFYGEFGVWISFALADFLSTILTAYFINRGSMT